MRPIFFSAIFLILPQCGCSSDEGAVAKAKAEAEAAKTAQAKAEAELAKTKTELELARAANAKVPRGEGFLPKQPDDKPQTVTVSGELFIEESGVVVRKGAAIKVFLARLTPELSEVIGKTRNKLIIVDDKYKDRESRSREMLPMLRDAEKALGKTVVAIADSKGRFTLDLPPASYLLWTDFLQVDYPKISELIFWSKVFDSRKGPARLILNRAAVTRFRLFGDWNVVGGDASWVDARTYMLLGLWPLR